MRKLIALSMVLVGILLVVTGCELFNGINLTWNIDSLAYHSPYTRVTYTVRNLGKYDLAGVNLEIGVDLNGNETYPVSAWTPDFSIGQDQVVRGSVDVLTGVPPLGWATVLSVDMDKPKD